MPFVNIRILEGHPQERKALEARLIPGGPLGHLQPGLKVFDDRGLVFGAELNEGRVVSGMHHLEEPLAQRLGRGRSRSCLRTTAKEPIEETHGPKI